MTLTTVDTKRMGVSGGPNVYHGAGLASDRVMETRSSGSGVRQPAYDDILQPVIARATSTFSSPKCASGPAHWPDTMRHLRSLHDALRCNATIS